VTELKHLWQAIIANPDLDGPRQAFHDFLESEGDPWAEFVRVQNELAQFESIKCQSPAFTGKGILDCDEWNSRHPDRNNWCWPCRQKKSLSHRERELLSAHRQTWLAQFLPQSLHKFVGVRCEKCDGTGEVVQLDPEGADRGGQCPHCHGSGLTDYGFRKGLTAVLSMTTMELMGWACRKCRGIGNIGVSHEPCSTAIMTCLECAGQKHIPGLAKLIGASMPVSEIRISDKRPVSGIDDDKFWRWTEDDEAQGSYYLSSELFQLLTIRTPSCVRISDEGPDWNSRSIRDYSSESAAQSALTRAAAQHCRNLASHAPQPELATAHG